MSLTDAQRDQLEAELIRLAAELRVTVSGTADQAQTVELDQTAVGRISRIDAIQAQKLAEATQSRSELRLQQIAVALRGFDDGSYGDCKVCGEPIPFARLVARPESPACVACMATLER